jgi:hypothetical protein
MPLLRSDTGEQLTGKHLVETLTAPNGDVLYTAKHEVNPDNTLETKDEHWQNDALKSINLNLLKGIEPVVRGGADGIAGAAVEAGKLAWDIIKEGKAVGQSSDAMTYVLSKADADPMNYVEARDSSSGVYTWEVNDSIDWFGKINYVTIRIKADGKYHAKPRPGSSAPAGYYLPSVYLDVAQCTVNFPCSASGSANLANPSNIGSVNEANAQVRIYAKLTAGWFAQYFGITVVFDATGRDGFRLIGKE